MNKGDSLVDGTRQHGILWMSPWGPRLPKSYPFKWMQIRVGISGHGRAGDFLPYRCFEERSVVEVLTKGDG